MCELGIVWASALTCFFGVFRISSAGQLCSNISTDCSELVYPDHFEIWLLGNLGLDLSKNFTIHICQKFIRVRSSLRDLRLPARDEWVVVNDDNIWKKQKELKSRTQKLSSYYIRFREVCNSSYGSSKHILIDHLGMTSDFFI